MSGLRVRATASPNVFSPSSLLMSWDPGPLPSKSWLTMFVCKAEGSEGVGGGGVEEVRGWLRYGAGRLGRGMGEG